VWHKLLLLSLWIGLLAAHSNPHCGDPVPVVATAGFGACSAVAGLLCPFTGGVGCAVAAICGTSAAALSIRDIGTWRVCDPKPEQIMEFNDYRLHRGVCLKRDYLLVSRNDIPGEGQSSELSAEACQARCARVPGCKFFSSWKFPNWSRVRCQLSGGTGRVYEVIDKAGIITGTKLCRGGRVEVQTTRAPNYFTRRGRVEVQTTQAPWKRHMCPSSWTALSSGCYLLDETKRTREGARSFCIMNQAKLIEVNSMPEDGSVVANLLFQLRMRRGSEVRVPWTVVGGGWGMTRCKANPRAQSSGLPKGSINSCTTFGPDTVDKYWDRDAKYYSALCEKNL